LKFETAQHKDLPADDVMALRHFLINAGWTPETTPETPPAPASAAMAIIIDHAGARIYELPLDASHHAPHEDHHLHHAIDRKQHDTDREETYPADHRFFDAIAKDLPGNARIVVVSHGKGQSNEGQHLLDYMQKHHRNLHDRIAKLIVADLAHTSVPQQLSLARDALLSAPDAADATSD
jgi:hypothetical protein